MEKPNEIQSKIPADLFELNYDEFDEFYSPTVEDRANQIFPKIKKILEDCKPEDKEVILEAVEFEAYQHGIDGEEAMSLMMKIYKKLILTK